MLFFCCYSSSRCMIYKSVLDQVSCGQEEIQTGLVFNLASLFSVKQSVNCLSTSSGVPLEITSSGEEKNGLRPPHRIVPLV